MLAPGQIVADKFKVERLLREARAVAKLKGDHGCRVLDAGVLASGAPFIAMELLDGSDLARTIADGPLAIERAVDYIAQAIVGIAEAHAAGIVHRDLKPANLFVARGLGGTTVVKVLDFGIAKRAGEAS